MIRAAEDEAGRHGYAVNIAVLDGGGHVIAQIRMDGALLAGVSEATNKAYTACAFAIATKDLAGFARTAEERAGITHSNEKRIVVAAGGIPLRRQGRVIGAIGVSGGTESSNEMIAEAGARAFNAEYGNAALRPTLSVEPAFRWNTPTQIARLGNQRGIGAEYCQQSITLAQQR